MSIFSFAKKPIIKENTFLLWEPCSKSHSEVLPGYAKYLLDLGFHVSIFVENKQLKEGLFSKFQNENISFNKMSNSDVRKYLKKNDLNNVKGILITTAGKLCDSIHYDDVYKSFNRNTDRTKIFLVEHEAKAAIDNNSWKENIITLRELDYKNAKSTVVNPHYFGNIETKNKNEKITNFITIGALRAKRNDSNLIVNSAKELVKKGYKNFKITIVGKGDLKHLPKELKPYFKIKGRLPFDKMYDELEKADFILTSYDKNNEQHKRYATTGTSGSFQLVFGFLKPCIIVNDFAPINGFSADNAILYDDNYTEALENAINMSIEDYKKMQNNLKTSQQNLFNNSLSNLKELINA